jgi:CheY-like chemotaxis protein
MVKRQIQRERQLNQYLAHEVRNPLSSAMSALSFAKATAKEKIPDPATQKLLMDDIHITESSLDFINELLRNMLDINRAVQHNIEIHEEPTNLLKDILEPTAAILCNRVGSGVKVEILTDCEPSDLVVVTDQLRLKQIILNLATNATKFVVHGFIRIRAEVKSDSKSVQLYVEDTGPGVTPEKMHHLFQERSQKSFDIMSQGTGVGLYICRYLADLLGAKLSFDKTYDSGVPGCPGARFVLDLQRGPLLAPFARRENDSSGESINSALADQSDAPSCCDVSPESASGGRESKTSFCDSIRWSSKSLPENDNDESLSTTHSTIPSEEEKEVVELSESQLPPSLPENIKALFVDDDRVLRKLFVRSVCRAAPGWTVEEAGNGEAALELAEETTYDIIFMDNYMPGSIERPLLGTETIQILRDKGVHSKICGVSANEMEKEFLEAGADMFLLKPFPCEKETLRKELFKILNS